ncbi:MAG: sugar ABC transporter ATP-binding protein [Anaerolineales bacterium]|nr:MAG: sugar ABC transporter ATP-binding protein [Anaerolineales bacterium]
MTDKNQNPSSESFALSLLGVSKRYGTVQALKNMDLQVLPGEVHAVVGENGSGKSTLLGIASGFVEQDEGTVHIMGKPLTTDSPAKARELGLGMAYQDISQVAGMTVAENLYLSASKDARPSTYWRLKDWAIQILARFELDDIFAEAPIGALALAERQLLEVAKALLSDPKVLLLDEPTTAMGPSEVEWLQRTIKEHTARGVAVVYVSHRLPEVLGLADRITVLRDGQNQGTYEADKITEKEIVELMIGRPLESAFPTRLEITEDTETVLKVTDLHGEYFGPVTFTVRRGEVIGIAGVEGNGQGDLFWTLCGAIPPKGGQVQVFDKHVNLTSPTGALNSGIMLLAGDRKRDALFLVLGAITNASLQALQKFTRLGWLMPRREREAVGAMGKQLKLRTPSLDMPVSFLSGGNQQKVVMARPFLRDDVNVLLADEPTQGVDVAARFDIYEALHTKAAEGAAVVVKSSDPIELASLCNRVFVISRGQIVHDIPQEHLSERTIIDAMVRGAKLGNVEDQFAFGGRED